MATRTCETCDGTTARDDGAHCANCRDGLICSDCGDHPDYCDCDPQPCDDPRVRTAFSEGCPE